MTDEVWKAGQGSLWVQLEGPNTRPQYLGCHNVGDVDEPRGDINLIFCPDPAQSGKFIVKGSYQTEPGPVTFSIETLLQTVSDYLERVDCPVPLFVHKGCGRRDVFTNWDRSFLFYPAHITNRGLTGLLARKPDDNTESGQSFDVSAEKLLRVYRPHVDRQAITETSALNDVAVCNTAKCADSCGPTKTACLEAFAVSNAPAGSPTWDADIWFTDDTGGTWTATAADPFGAGEDIASGVCFEIGKNTTRHLVARGTTDPAAPMEVAYSDDGGATWTLVNVGAVNGQYAMGPGALFALDQYHIWLVTDGGYIYFSNDGGATWAAQEEGTITVQDLWAVHALDEDNVFVSGAADTLLHSGDGGTTWAAAGGVPGAGDDLICIWMISEDLIWTGSDGGHLYYSDDGGTTWTERTFSGSGAGTIPDLAFKNALEGYMLHNTAAPVGTVFYTINGGYNWEPLTTPTNAGLNAVALCENGGFVVGEPSGGTAVVLRVLAQ